MLVYVKRVLLIVMMCSAGIGAQTLLKKGLAKVGAFQISEVDRAILPMFTNLYVIAGLAILIVLSFVYLSLLSKMDLSSLYPIIVGVNFVLLMVVSLAFLKETLSLFKLIGIFLIISGVLIISISQSGVKQ